MNRGMVGGMKLSGRLMSRLTGLGGYRFPKKRFVIIAATVITLSFGSAAMACPTVGPVPDNIKAWWTFDNPASLGHDRAGIWNNYATPYGGVLAMEPGQWCGLGDWASFDGINDHLSAPNHAELNVGTGDISVDFWVRTTKTTGVQTIIDKRSSAPYRGYHVFMWKGAIGLQLADGNGYTNYMSKYADGPEDLQYPDFGWIADGDWHHVAITVDRDQSNGIKFWVDGSFVNTRNPLDRRGDLTNTAQFRIGVNSFGAYRFTGDLDELDIVAGVIPDNQIPKIATPWGKYKG